MRHFNVTAHPTAEWVKQQLREAFPFGEGARYLIHDRNAIFRSLAASLKTFGITLKRTTFRSPWQNRFVERMNGSLRRNWLNHVISLNEDHLRRLLKDYLHYYHEDRTHLGLSKDSHMGRPVDSISSGFGQLMVKPRRGSSHHRYDN